MSKVEKTKGNLIKCLCMKTCPSYGFACKMTSLPSNTILLVSDMEKKLHAETMFCAYEKSTCIDEEKGCMCGSCEVFKKYGLDRGYFCITDGGK